MAGVIAALVPDYVVRLCGEDVYHLAFAFITPLRAYYDRIGHMVYLLSLRD
jgi:hypothetical protein